MEFISGDGSITTVFTQYTSLRTSVDYRWVNISKVLQYITDIYNIGLIFSMLTSSQ